MNENLPLYAFANTYSTLDVSLNDLRLQISIFEYAPASYTHLLFTGTINRTEVHPREVIKRALHHNAAAVVLALSLIQI